MIFCMNFLEPTRTHLLHCEVIQHAQHAVEEIDIDFGIGLTCQDVTRLER